MTLKYRIHREVIDQVCTSRCPVNSFRYVSFSIKVKILFGSIWCCAVPRVTTERLGVRLKSALCLVLLLRLFLPRRGKDDLNWDGPVSFFLCDSTAACLHSRSFWFSLNFQKVFLIKIQNVIICHHSNIWMCLTKHCMLFVILILFMSGILVNGLL